MPGIFPPISTPLMVEGEERLTKPWEGFFTDIDSTMGTLQGNIFFNKDTVKVDGQNRDLNIGTGDNLVTLNNFTWSNDIQRTKVLVLNTSKNISYSAPESVFTVYELSLIHI